MDENSEYLHKNQLKLCFYSFLLLSTYNIWASDYFPGRTAFVQLLEWKWADVATECETFLGPNGFAAVQVSPPNENRVMKNRPWYERYQPVSYKINTRSGNRLEFANMVKRCKAVKVDIYVDTIINHMADGSQDQIAYGTGQTPFRKYNYSDYNPNHFHFCGRYGDNQIRNWSDRYEVQNCELVYLADLDTGLDYVQRKIASYLNDLIDLGVSGFRVDAAKHISADDYRAVLSHLKNPTYLFHEIIDFGSESIQATEYFEFGDVTEFKYASNISRIFLDGKLGWMEKFGTDWGFMPSHMVVVFTDNHDLQRHQGLQLSYKNGHLYILANIFMLAWPYGYPRIMSSFDFKVSEQGPPVDADGNILSIHENGKVNCFKEWICEHRNPAISAMVGFRNFTNSSFYISKWWSNGNNQIAFSRGEKGFVAINRENRPLIQAIETDMAPGTYLDVIGNSPVKVDEKRTIRVNLPAMSALAIHIGAPISSH